MKALLRLVVLTFVTTMFATVAALVVERAQPATADVPGLGLCEGVPCFGRIVPDKTSMGEAKQQIQLLFGLSPDLFEPDSFGDYLHYDLTRLC